MCNNITPHNSKICSLLIKERKNIFEWVSGGDTLSAIYKKLCDKHSEKAFSSNGFLYSFRNYDYDLYMAALKNKSKTRLLILKNHDKIAASICSGHTLKEVYQIICEQTSYSRFITQLRKNYPELHLQGKMNRITRLKKRDSR